MNVIALARQAAFRLGSVEVRPATRTLWRDGREQVIEPRVMQVLVVLAEAQGAVVSRDELVERCWKGRIVGDDAVNRVISRLRQLERHIGRGSFAVETVTRVGYRLRGPQPSLFGEAMPAPPPADFVAPGIDRRALICAGAGGLALLGGVALSKRPAAPPPRIAALMAQAETALCQQTSESVNQAIGMLQQAVAEAPRYANGWATLGITYNMSAQKRSRLDAAAVYARGHAAGQRARALDGGNSLAEFAIGGARPLFGHWQDIEIALERARTGEPDHKQLLFWRQHLMRSVGRIGEAVRVSDRLVKMVPFTPGFAHHRINSLWTAGRMEEADQVMAEAARMFPNHYAIWFDRFYVAMASGRAEAALALAADRSQRPATIPDRDIAAVVRLAQAVQSREPQLVRSVIEENTQRAFAGAGYAENSVGFLTFLGEHDRALALLRAYYFGEGGTIPEIAFAPEQGLFVPFNDRSTNFLFKPLVAPLRRRPEFAEIVRRIGLADYWRRSGRAPDYLA